VLDEPRSWDDDDALLACSRTCARVNGAATALATSHPAVPPDAALAATLVATLGRGCTTPSPPSGTGRTARCSSTGRSPAGSGPGADPARVVLARVARHAAGVQAAAARLLGPPRAGEAAVTARRAAPRRLPRAPSVRLIAGPPRASVAERRRILPSLRDRRHPAVRRPPRLPEPFELVGTSPAVLDRRRLAALGATGLLRRGRAGAAGRSRCSIAWRASRRTRCALPLAR
jgi:hypothetical protein